MFRFIGAALIGCMWGAMVTASAAGVLTFTDKDINISSYRVNSQLDPVVLHGTTRNFIFYKNKSPDVPETFTLESRTPDLKPDKLLTLNYGGAVANDGDTLYSAACIKIESQSYLALRKYDRNLAEIAGHNIAVDLCGPVRLVVRKSTVYVFNSARDEIYTLKLNFDLKVLYVFPLEDIYPTKNGFCAIGDYPKRFTFTNSIFETLFEFDVDRTNKYIEYMACEQDNNGQSYVSWIETTRNASGDQLSRLKIVALSPKGKPLHSFQSALYKNTVLSNPEIEFIKYGLVVTWHREAAKADSGQNVVVVLKPKLGVLQNETVIRRSTIKLKRYYGYDIERRIRLTYIGKSVLAYGSTFEDKIGSSMVTDLFARALKIN